MTEDTTSDMRRALCAAIVGAALDRARSDHAAVSAWLQSELDVLPFERRGDNGLVAMGRQVLAPATVDRILATQSADRYEAVEMFLCPDCRDERLIQTEPGAWSRCLRCNPLPEPVDEGEVSKHRRRR